MNKILVIIPTLHQGGAERVVSRLTQEWCKQHDVTVAVFDNKQQAYTIGGELVDLKCPARPSYIGKFFNIIIRIYKLKAVIRDENPDYIISFMESASIPTYVATALLGRRDKLIVSIRTNPNVFLNITKLFIVVFYQKTKKIIAVSEGVRQALINIGIKEEKVITIPNLIDVTTQKSDCFTHWSRYQPYILAVGRLEHQKGFDRLIKTFAILENKKINLLILGEGGLRKPLKNLTEELSISNRVYLPGSSTDVINAYHQAELFVLSSRHEGWPNVLMEAMANGCPAISFNCHYGPSEIIKNNINGILVEEGDANQLRYQIDSLLEDPELGKKLAAQAVEDMKQYSTEVIAKKWLI